MSSSADNDEKKFEHGRDGSEYENMLNLIPRKVQIVTDEMSYEEQNIYVLDKDGKQILSKTGNTNAVTIICPYDLQPFANTCNWLKHDNPNALTLDNLRDAFDNGTFYALHPEGDLKLNYQLASVEFIKNFITFNRDVLKDETLKKLFSFTKPMYEEYLPRYFLAQIEVHHYSEFEENLHEKIKKCIEELLKIGALSFKEDSNVIALIHDEDKDNFIKLCIIHAVNAPMGKNKEVFGMKKSAIRNKNKEAVPLSYFKRATRGMVENHGNLFEDLAEYSAVYKYFGSFWPVCETEIKICRELINPSNPNKVSIAACMNFIEQEIRDDKAVSNLKDKGKFQILLNKLKNQKKYGKKYSVAKKYLDDIDAELEKEEEEEENYKKSRRRAKKDIKEEEEEEEEVHHDEF